VREPRKIPTVLSEEEIVRLLEAGGGATEGRGHLRFPDRRCRNRSPGRLEASACPEHHTGSLHPRS